MAVWWYGAVTLLGLKWYGEMGTGYPEAPGRAWMIALALTAVGAALGRMGFRLKV